LAFRAPDSEEVGAHRNKAQYTKSKAPSCGGLAASATSALFHTPSSCPASRVELDNLYDGGARLPTKKEIGSVFLGVLG